MGQNWGSFPQGYAHGYRQRSTKADRFSRGGVTNAARGDCRPDDWCQITATDDDDPRAARPGNTRIPLSSRDKRSIGCFWLVVVGWVERSDTHHLLPFDKEDGLRSPHPTNCYPPIPIGSPSRSSAPNRDSRKAASPAGSNEGSHSKRRVREPSPRPAPSTAWPTPCDDARAPRRR